MAGDAPPRPPAGGPEPSCPHCGERNPPGFRFCGSCGRSLERPCPACGALIPLHFRFCGNCGHPMDAPEHAAPTPAAEAPLEERKVVTTVVADLAASTELAARLDPEDLRDVLRPFFEAMAEEVERHGGTVQKYVGDAVVAVFGFPAAHEDDPQRALRAALAMQRRLPALNERVAPAGTTLALRVGVTTGEVVTAVGIDAEGLVTGEPVNVASRFQSLASPGAVVVGERTYRDCRDGFEFRPLGPVEVKGLDHPLLAWEVLGERRAEAERVIPPAPFVGREQDLELLRLLLARCVREQRANLVTVLGPAGIGKTRLAEEFVRRAVADEPAARVVRGRCLPYGEGLTYWPLAEILKADAGILDTDEAEAALEKTRAAVGPRLGESAGADGRILLASIGAEVRPDPLAHTDAEGARQLIARAWRRYLETLPGDGPLLAVIEDLHWADGDLLDLLEDLAARIEAPALFLCLARPELSERRPDWGGGLRNASSVALSPLTPREGEDLVRGLLGDGAPPDLVGAVLRRAEGNPFFAGELLRMLVEDGSLIRAEGAWRLERPLPAEMPDTVQGVIAARIDLLPPEEKRAIQDASVVGRVFWSGAVERLGGERATGALDRLVEKGLLHEQPSSTIEGERQFAFDHVLIREVAYRSIPKDRRRRDHAEVGAWVEDKVSGRAEEFAEILAHHAARAEDAERTARYALLAGRRKLRLFAGEAAIGWLERALEAAGRLGDGESVRAEALVERGHAAELVARFPDAERDYRDAVGLLEEAGDERLRARAMASLAHVLWLQDRYEEGREILAEALGAARGVGASDLTAWLLYTAGTIAFGRGEWADSVSFQREALAVAVEAGDREGEALAEHGLSETLMFSGPLEEALRHGERSSALLEDLEQWPMLHHNEYTICWILNIMGRFGEALRRLDASIVGMQEVGDHRNEVHARAARAVARLARGDAGGAVADVEGALEVAAGVESLRTPLICRAFLLEVLAELGAFDRMPEHLEEALRLSDRLGGTQLRPRLFAFRGWLALRRGDEEGADAAFTQAEELAGSTLWEQMTCARVRLLAWEDAGSAEGLAREGERLCRLARGQSESYYGWGLYGQAEAALLGRNVDRALELAEAAWETGGEIGEVPLTWRAAALSARALDDLGRAEESEARRGLARGLVRELAATLPEDLRAAFARRPPVADLLAE